MKLAELHIHNLRNILQARIHLDPHINFIIGNNGSGKTSFLEAIYLLSSGHSFRNRDIVSLVSHQQQQLTVFAKTCDEQTLSIQKSNHQTTIAKINGTPCLTNSELASFLPCQVFYQDIFQIMDAGPAYRRSLLDWGVFHVEPNYLSVWKNYKRSLKQRNTLLKQKASKQLISPWNQQLSIFSDLLHVFRQRYLDQIKEKFEICLAKISSIECQLSYYKGWDRREDGFSLEQILEKNYESDCLRQFTQYGAHHADILFQYEFGKAKSILSRGQQKMILFALKFAQAQLLSDKSIVLIDDLTSELDQVHVDTIMNLIQDMDCQTYISIRKGDNLIQPTSFTSSQCLYMEEGQINSVPRGT